MKLLTTRKNWILMGAVALFMGGATLRVKAFNPQPDPPAFGMIGVDNYETARLNAFCADGPLPGGVQPGPCDVTLVFRDVGGRVVKQMTATLLPGQGTFLDLRGADVQSAPTGEVFGRRSAIQPLIRPAGRGFVLATAEVFDNFTGRISAALNPTEPKSLSGPAGGL